MQTHAATGTLLTRATGESQLAPAIKAAAVVFGVVLTASAAQFTSPVPFTAVPFALTPMVVLLTGAALGPRLGALTQIAYLALGAAGLPVFAPSGTLPPGLLRLAGPTAGYLIAYPLAAFVAGWLAERGWDRIYLRSVIAMTAGLSIIFAGGLSWLVLAFGQSISGAIATGLAPFIVADVIKILAAAAILPTVWKALRN